MAELKRRSRWCGLLGGLALFAAASVAAGQSPAGIAGNVKPTPGTAQLGASSTAESMAGGLRRLSHVRTLVKDGFDAADLLADGIARSPAVERLVMALERSNLMVLIEAGYRDACPRGRVALLRSHDDRPAVLVSVCAFNLPNVRIAILAHELQHALEIAEIAAAGRGAVDCEALEAIGWSWSRRRTVFETEAAIEAGRQALNELRDRQLQRERARRVLPGRSQ